MKYHVMEKGGLMDILFWTNNKKATCTCETYTCMNQPSFTFIIATYFTFASLSVLSAL